MALCNSVARTHAFVMSDASEEVFLPGFLEHSVFARTCKHWSGKALTGYRAGWLGE